MTAASFTAGTELPVRSLTANNFAFESENKIHADDVAAQFGFKGGLVPGVGVLAYMTQPIVEALGRDWLERGHLVGKFIQPVYHDEVVTLHANVANESPLTFKLEARNAQNELCGVGEASLPDSPPTPPDRAQYPQAPQPAAADRFPPRISALTADETVMGSLECEASWQTPLEGPDPFVDAVCDPLPIYRGPEAACHPALIAAYANRLLKNNVDLGPWIHTASDVQFFALPAEGQPVSLRGKVAKTFEKRGHEIVELDLALFDAADRVLTHIIHTAIVYPAAKRP